MSTANELDPKWALYYKWRRLQREAEGNEQLPFAAGVYRRFADELEQILAIPETAVLSKEPYAYACPVKCGCIWRDNRDGTMSLFGKNSTSCEVCEPLPLTKLIPLYALLAKPAQGNRILGSKIKTGEPT